MPEIEIRISKKSWKKNMTIEGIDFEGGQCITDIDQVMEELRMQSQAPVEDKPELLMRSRTQGIGL